jgi:hypothetical protein
MGAPCVAQRIALPFLLAALCGVVAVASVGAADKLGELQARFDSETNGVHKARMLQKLGDAEFEEASRAEKAGDYNTVGVIMEKYRDNVRAASAAIEKESPDGERHPNGYKQLEMHVQKGLRELDEILLLAPAEFKPPLQLVRKDLLSLDDKLLRSLFPRRHENKPTVPATPPTTPAGPEVHP